MLPISLFYSAVALLTGSIIVIPPPPQLFTMIHTASDGKLGETQERLCLVYQARPILCPAPNFRRVRELV